MYIFEASCSLRLCSRMARAPPAAPGCRRSAACSTNFRLSRRIGERLRGSEVMAVEAIVEVEEDI
eukprot:765026-Hanusia_phi.AAC.3